MYFFFGRKHANPTVNTALQPGLQKAFQTDTASVVARWRSKWGKSKCRRSDRITVLIYLHIFVNLTVLKQEEKGILILLQNTDPHCITFQVQSTQAHRHTKII